MKVRFLILFVFLLSSYYSSTLHAEPSKHLLQNNQVEKIKLSECRVDAAYDAARMEEDSDVWGGVRYYGAFYHHSFLLRENWLYIIMDPYGNVTRQEVTQETQMSKVFSRQSQKSRPESFNPEWVRRKVKEAFDLTIVKVAPFQCKAADTAS